MFPDRHLKEYGNISPYYGTTEHPQLEFLSQKRTTLEKPLFSTIGLEFLRSCFPSKWSTSDTLHQSSLPKPKKPVTILVQVLNLVWLLHTLQRAGTFHFTSSFFFQLGRLTFELQGLPISQAFAGHFHYSSIAGRRRETDLLGTAL
jgi:hypothetical protein